MRPRTLLIVVALVCGLLVIGMLLFTLQAPPAQQQASIHPPNVIVAAQAIPVGTLIKPQDLTFAAAPADSLPAATFDRVWTDKPEDQAAADNRTIAEIVGAVARHRIEAGEAVNRGGVVKPGDSGFLAAVLRPGMRAVTVAVTAVTGTGGLIYPGDHVDMILTQSFQSSNDNIAKKSSSETVADNLRVLAIDQQLQIKNTPDNQQPGKIAQTVTLETDPVQAQKVALAQKMGELSLVIRSLESADSSQVATDGTTAPSAGPAAVPGTATPAGAAGAVPQMVQAPNAPIWAEDVSPALKMTAQEAKKDEKPVAAPKPPMLVIRGDKADEVGVK